MCEILHHESKKHLAYYAEGSRLHPIFNSPAGVCTKILKTGFKQLDSMLSYYSKVTMVLLQFHVPDFSYDNKSLSIFISRLKRKLSKHYGKRLGYLWVREQDNSKAQHYHMCIMLNGHKCQSTRRIDAIVKSEWESFGERYFSYRIRNRIYRINRTYDVKELRAAKTRLSYLAKLETKQRTPRYTKTYHASSLQPRKITC